MDTQLRMCVYVIIFFISNFCIAAVAIKNQDRTGLLSSENGE